MAQLRAQADERRTKRREPNRRSSKEQAEANGAGGTAVQIRQLKDVSKLQPSNGAVVNPGVPRGGIIVPDRRRRGGTGGAGGNGTCGNGHVGPGRRSTVLPPMSG